MLSVLNIGGRPTSTSVLGHFGPRSLCPVWARGRCRISPPRFLAECCKRQLNQVSLVLLYFRLSAFYRAMLCIRGTSHGPVSVCLSVSVSVTSRSSTKTARRRITQTTAHDSPETLVFCCHRSPRNSTGVTPYEGAECRWGVSKSATFDE